MKYRDGNEVHLGDSVDIGGGMGGVVVAVIDANEFSADYPEAEWKYLRIGALVDSPELGLMYFDSSEHDFDLIRRVDDSPQAMEEQ